MEGFSKSLLGLSLFSLFEFFEEMDGRGSVGKMLSCARAGLRENGAELDEGRHGPTWAHF